MSRDIEVPGLLEFRSLQAKLRWWANLFDEPYATSRRLRATLQEAADEIDLAYGGGPEAIYLPPKA